MLEDKQIIDLYFLRDERAIEETDLKYGRMCLQLAGNILKFREDREECINDAYLTVWNKIPPERPRYLKAFISKIVRNHALKKLEIKNTKKRNINITTSFGELEEIFNKKNGDGYFEINCIELTSLIEMFLMKEKEETRYIFISRYFLFDSISEIARKYGMGENKVTSVLYRTRRRLKNFLTEEGIEI